MPSEYDFLLPYSRGLRRTGRLALISAAFIAGVASTALIIALPLRPVSNDKVATDDKASVQATDEKASIQAQKTAPTVSSEKAAPPVPPERAAPVERSETAATASNAAAPPQHPRQQPQPRAAASEKAADRTTGSTGTWSAPQATADNTAPPAPSPQAASPQAA